MDFSFITEEEEEDSFSSLSSEALTRVLLLLFLSWFVFFFVNVVFCFVVVVVIEEGGRTPLPLRRRIKAPLPPRGQKNAAFSEKAEDDANIIIVIKVRLLRACVCLCFKWPALCALRLILMERISFFSSSSFPHFERRVSNVYLRQDDDEDDDDEDDNNDEKSFSHLFAKIHFF